MTPDSAQIIEMYDVLGMSVADISQGLGYEEAAIKVVLAQFSSKYAEKCSLTEGLDCKISDDFTESDKIAAKATIAYLARNAEDEYLRGRMAIYIRNDTKGRLDVGVGRGLNINIGQINNLIASANDKIANAKKVQPVIVPEKERKLIENASDINV